MIPFYLHVLPIYMYKVQGLRLICLCNQYAAPPGDNFYVHSPHANAASDTEGPMLEMLSCGAQSTRLSIDLQNGGCTISRKDKISNFICLAKFR